MVVRPDGIVVLGGAINAEATVARGSLEMDQSGERILTMLKLARQYPSARIVFSGGSGNLIVRTRFLRHPPQDNCLKISEWRRTGSFWKVDPAPRPRMEKAQAPLVSPKLGERWLLVTSAFHMPRSIGSFRKVGSGCRSLPPVDWRSQGWSEAFNPFDKMSDGLARADSAIHEWTGLIGYWLTGHSSELFPGLREPRARKDINAGEGCKRD